MIDLETLINVLNVCNLTLKKKNLGLSCSFNPFIIIKNQKRTTIFLPDLAKKKNTVKYMLKKCNCDIKVCRIF